MTQEQQQTANTGVPPVPQFDFGSKPATKPATKPEVTPDSDTGQQEETGTEEQEQQTQGTKPNDSGSRRGSRKSRKKNVAGETSKALQQFQPKRYENLSTKARKSIQNALAELNHIRRKDPKGAIKYFIEEAVTEWNDSKRSSINYVPRDTETFPATDDDPRQTFNNEIEDRLKEVLADICHERKKVGHPLSTVISILDDAFCQWLPKQEDLPREYVDAVLRTSQ